MVRGTVRGEEFHEIEDLESGRPREAQQIARPEVEFDAGIVVDPVEAIQSSLRTPQARAAPAGVRRAQGGERGVAKKHQFPADA